MVLLLPICRVVVIVVTVGVVVVVVAAGVLLRLRQLTNLSLFLCLSGGPSPPPPPQPNCYAQVIYVQNKPKIVIYAKRNLKAGEECVLVYHYMGFENKTMHWSLTYEIVDVNVE